MISLKKLAKQLNATQQEIITRAWLRMQMRLSAGSLVDETDAVNIRKCMGQGAADPIPSSAQVGKGVKPKRGKKVPPEDALTAHLRRNYQRLGIPFGGFSAGPRRPPLSPLPSDWREHLVEEDRNHLMTLPRQMQVHLKRGLEAVIQWPAAYIQKSAYFFVGDTLPPQVRTASRPGNFILEPASQRSHPILVKAVSGPTGTRYFYALAPEGIRQARTLAPADWHACPNYRIVTHQVTL